MPRWQLPDTGSVLTSEGAMADSSASVADVTGADGARSRVLTEAGLTVEGPDDPGRNANIWLRADLARFST
jgi:hypothetical protein